MCRSPNRIDFHPEPVFHNADIEPSVRFRWVTFRGDPTAEILARFCGHKLAQSFISRSKLLCRIGQRAGDTASGSALDGGGGSKAGF